MAPKRPATLIRSATGNEEEDVESGLGFAILMFWRFPCLTLSMHYAVVGLVLRLGLDNNTIDTLLA